jgi:hypothetical protein
MIRDDNLRTGQQTAASASPAGPEGGEKSTAAKKRWTFRRRMNALAVLAIAMALFKLFNWLTTPAPRAPDYSGIIVPGPSPLARYNEPVKWDNIPYSSQAPNPPIKSK